jgi:dTDP-4-amino-4,6-dideoxygalactose transaminase
MTTASTLQVPYIDLALQHRAIKAELLEAAASVIDSGQFILGPEVELFEREMATLCGVKHAIGVNSGTDALILSLKALGIGEGDEVITAPNSFVASASAIALAGATPVFADVGADYQIDPAAVEQAITSRTRAILPVHLTGKPANMTAIMELAAKHHLAVVEDAAQAIAAEHRGRRVGSWGDAGCFSLHPLKTLNACGDGGVVTTNRDDVAEKVRLLRNLGLRTREKCEVWSSNSRLDSMQAAMLRVKLRYLTQWTEKRIANAAYYRRALADVKEVICPSQEAHDKAVYHTFVIQAQRRDELKNHLAACGVQTAIHYPIPIHLQPVAQDLGYKPGSFPQAESQASHILSLPVFPELTQQQLDHVIKSIRQFYQG